MNTRPLMIALLTGGLLLGGLPAAQAHNQHDDAWRGHAKVLSHDHRGHHRHGLHKRHHRLHKRHHRLQRIERRHWRHHHQPHRVYRPYRHNDHDTYWGLQLFLGDY